MFKAVKCAALIVKAKHAVAMVIVLLDFIASHVQSFMLQLRYVFGTLREMKILASQARREA